MKLTDYLVESKTGRSKKIEIEEAADTIRKNCQKSWNLFRYRSNALWRGHVKEAKFKYVEPKKFRRKSANTTNHYTLWLDNAPSLKKWPKRSKSLICGNRARAAYGGNSEKFAVLPFDGSNIGVSPDADFWEAFGSTYKRTLDNLNRELEAISDKLLGDGPRFDTSYKALKARIKEMDYQLAGMPEDAKGLMAYQTTLLRRAHENKMTIQQTMDWILDYERNGFGLYSAGQHIPDDYDRECWTDGNSVMINYWVTQDEMQMEKLDALIRGK